MKNYSRNNAAKGKTAYRTGDKWRARKQISVLNIKSGGKNVARMKFFGKNNSKTQGGVSF